MGTWLFLRSAHPSVRERTKQPPSRNLSKNDDMWTVWFNTLTHKAGVRGIILRVGNSYRVDFNQHLSEIRLPELHCLGGLNDVTLCINRGGYREYMPLVNLLRRSVRHAYIGCGTRYNPVDAEWMQSINFNLVWVDSPSQQETLNELFKSHVFPKPTVERIFKSIRCPKKYDLVFVCRTPKEFKGCKWLAERVPSGSSVLYIGDGDPWFEREFADERIQGKITGRVERKDIPALACQALMGVVCDEGKKDSGPRVFSEFLAMNLPVIVRSCVRIDHHRCINEKSGVIVGERVNDLGDAMTIIKHRLAKGKLAPREVYDKNMSIDVSTDEFLNEVDAFRK